MPIAGHEVYSPYHGPSIWPHNLNPYIPTKYHVQIRAQRTDSTKILQGSTTRAQGPPKPMIAGFCSDLLGFWRIRTSNHEHDIRVTQHHVGYFCKLGVLFRGRPHKKSPLFGPIFGLLLFSKTLIYSLSQSQTNPHLIRITSLP